MRSRVLLLGIIVSLMLSTAGCSGKAAATNVATGKNTVATPKSTTSQQVPPSSSKNEQDGTVISWTPLHLSNLAWDEDAYKMMYWSDHIQVEALVAVPKGAPGAYPLYVVCHGGWAAFQPYSHDNLFDDDYNHTDSQAQDEKWFANWADNGFIAIVPFYRGYGGSNGSVSDIDANTTDANNAIRAVLSRYRVIPNHIYLYGVSMGGAVALKLASQRSDIRSVIANSPFVGWDLVGQWAETHPRDPMAQNFMNRMTSHYGAYAPNSSTYKRVSVDYQKIKAPVLLLQGDNDASVPWQSVQLLYNDMKANHQTVELDMFPGGTHGLPNQPDVKVDVNQWYVKYGEDTSS